MITICTLHNYISHIIRLMKNTFPIHLTIFDLNRYMDRLVVGWIQSIFFIACPNFNVTFLMLSLLFLWGSVKYSLHFRIILDPCTYKEKQGRLSIAMYIVAFIVTMSLTIPITKLVIALGINGANATLLVISILLSIYISATKLYDRKKLIIIA